MFSTLRKALSPSATVDDIKSIDVRFPNAEANAPSDAIHRAPDFSAAYVLISVKGVSHVGHGYTFTLGRGTEVVVEAVKALSPLLIGRSLLSIYINFGSFWHQLVNESQLRWIGPEKGVVHIATAGIINALWDLWGKIEEKPVWKVLCDLTAEEIVTLVDFTYLSDTLTKAEAIAMLSKLTPTRSLRIKELERKGYPTYITSVGWLGYGEKKIRDSCRRALESGFTRFKMKVGDSVEDDARRAGIIREEVGWDAPLMMDVNQVRSLL